jgi:hypothetical protein
LQLSACHALSVCCNGNPPTLRLQLHLNSTMTPKLQYTSQISDSLLYSIKDENLCNIQDKKSDFIPEGKLVELYLRCSKLFSSVDILAFQKVLKYVATLIPVQRVKTVLFHVQYRLIPKWKRSKRNLLHYFHSRSYSLRADVNCSSDSEPLKAMNMSESLQEPEMRLKTLLATVEDHCEFKEFMKFCHKERTNDCIEAIAEDFEFQRDMMVALDFVVDATMQASWRDDIGLSYHQLRLLRKDLSKFPIASERQVKEQVASDIQEAVPVHEAERRLDDNTVITFSITDLKTKMLLAAAKLINHELITPRNNTLRIKISGDGYLRTHKLGHVLFTFTFLDTELAHQSYATWDLCVLDGDENMDSVAIVMEEISKQMNECDCLSIGENEYKTEFFFSSDQKFLALVLGKSGANSKYFCNWCECTKENRGMVNQDAPLRTIEHMVHLAEKIPNSKSGAEKWMRGEGKGIVRLPSLTNVDMNHIVPDVMHLFLRIVEKFLLCLFKYYEDDPLISKRYLEELRLLLGNKKFQFRYKTDLVRKPNLDGTTLKWIMKNLPKKLIFAKFAAKPEATSTLKDLGCTLTVLFDTLWSSKVLNSEEQVVLKSQIEKLAELWTLVFAIRSWNNSCHVLHKHVMNYIALYGNIYKFSQEHVEGKIGRMKTFLKQTASKSATNTKSLMEFDNRKLNKLESSISKTTHRQCRSCSGTDHYRRSSKKCRLNKKAQLLQE